MENQNTKIPFNLQYFAETKGVSDAGSAGAESQDTSASTGLDTAGLTNLLNQFAQSQAGQAQPPAQGSEDNQQQNDAGASSADDGANGSVSDNQNQNNAQTQQQKDANAFAAMRVQNKQLSDMLEKIAKAAGIQYSNQQELMQKLNDDALTKLAAQQNVPVELLKRMEMLEENNRLFEQQQNQTRLTNEFAALQAKYNLDVNAMTQFAQQLDADGVDPYKVNIIREYESRNLDAIIEQRTQAAVQAALRADANAGAHSSTPNAAQGSSTDGGAQQHSISNSAELNKLLATMGK